jgi:hypothetical protein
MILNALILEIHDPITGCISDEVEFNDAEIPKLLSILEIENSEFFGIGYDLNTNDIKEVAKNFEKKFSSENVTNAVLRARGAWDDLPYKIHTNRELLLMLAGKKPLSVFYSISLSTDISLGAPHDKFEPYIKAGRFVVREYIEIDQQDNSLSMRWILYALPAEAWRIDAYILMKKTARLCGWNDGFERFEGSLLGYTDEQNNINLLQNK